VPSLPSPREEAANPTAAPGGAVFTAPAPGPTVAGSAFLRGAVFGAVVALAGVLVGAVVARRRA
jgi:hypothetical protein